MERVSRKFMSKCLVSRKLIVDSSYVCGRFVWFHGGRFSSVAYNGRRASPPLREKNSNTNNLFTHVRVVDARREMQRFLTKYRAELVRVLALSRSIAIHDTNRDTRGCGYKREYIRENGTVSGNPIHRTNREFSFLFVPSSNDRFFFFLFEIGGKSDGEKKRKNESCLEEIRYRGDGKSATTYTYSCHWTTSLTIYAKVGHKKVRKPGGEGVRSGSRGSLVRSARGTPTMELVVALVDSRKVRHEIRRWRVTTSGKWRFRAS